MSRLKIYHASSQDGKLRVLPVIMDQVSKEEQKLIKRLKLNTFF